MTTRSSPWRQPGPQATPGAPPLGPGTRKDAAGGQIDCLQHACGACRSCPHLDAPVHEQLAAKQARVAALLAAGHNPVAPGCWQAPVPSAPKHFRNKAKMVVSGVAGEPVLGIVNAAGQAVDLRDCPLHVPALQTALEVLSRFVADWGVAPYDVGGRSGELKHLLVTASPDGDLMVRFVLRSHRHVAELRAALPGLRRELPGLAVLSANIQPVHQAVLEGPEEVVLTESPGGDRLLMRLSLVPEDAEGQAGQAGPGRRTDLPLWLPTRSFFQTSTQVAEALYAQARQWALRPLDGDRADVPEGGSPVRVWDLFCGVGGFALALAGPGRQVLGVELSEAAVDGARDSARLMGLGPQEVRFEVGDARVLDPGAASALGGAPDLLVVNPPRRGIGELAAAVEASGVSRVLYSSCNPASLASDLEEMPSMRVVRARLFDMFPHTDHAEVLVELARG